MLRLILVAFSGLALAACGNQTEVPVDGDTAEILPADAFMADYIPWNPEAENVQTTPSGLQYVVVNEGVEDGKTPSARDRVSVMYEGRLVDGTVFDSSYARGTTSSFGVSEVIRGWTEGLQLMSEGDEFIFYIPTELAYGNNPRPGLIQPGDDLIFRVELRQVIVAPEPRTVDADAWAKYTPWNSDLPDVQKTGSGLEYVILSSGEEGGLSPVSDELAVVFYEGRLNSDGALFDSAFKRGEAAMFPANRVIPGWVEALRLMKPGDRWMVHVPAGLAYGARGAPPNVPPNADLNFEVELMDILPVQ